jgi:hypothetical protein
MSPACGRDQGDERDEDAGERVMSDPPATYAVEGLSDVEVWAFLSGYQPFPWPEPLIHG